MDRPHLSFHFLPVQAARHRNGAASISMISFLQFDF